MNEEAAESFTLLLVEDNPGDARLIREMLNGAGELSRRVVAQHEGMVVEQATTAGDETTVVHETRLADGLDRLADADVVLLDLNLPDSEGLATLRAVRQHSTTVPVVVLTGVSDRQTGMDALNEGADEYLVKDEINADLLIRSVYHGVERKAHEREIERQRDELATLNSLNELVHDISAAVFESTTREAIERLVCDHLAESGAYLFAWIGEVDRIDKTVTTLASAGVDGYPTDVPIRLDESVQGPTGKTVRSGEVHVARDVLDDPSYEPWQEAAREYGFRASAAIPIEYEETLYGVLNVYSDRPDAFGPNERAVVGRLGRVVGHAINAIQRKQALMSRDVVEVRFEVENVVERTGIAANDGGVRFDHVVPVSDDVYLMYGTVEPNDVETLERLVEQLPHFESVKLLDDDRTGGRFEARLTGPPAISELASYGARVESAAIDGGDYRLVVHAPPSADVSQMLDAVRGVFPNAEVRAQRHLTRTDQSVASLASDVRGDLTEKQRASLESAYFAGFFEWPRDTTGEEMAESMGVSPSTFHQHVRVGEQKVFEALFDPDDADD